MDELPRRKNIRLKDYDYSQSGYYFITICTQNRLNFFGEIVGADDSVRPNIEMSDIGKIICDCWHKINNIYADVRTEAFCVMPNHIHGIIVIENTGGQSRPPLQKIVQGFKSVTTRLCFPLGYQTIWQKSYHDHIIRNEAEYLIICQYIDENPIKWAEDCYFVK